MNRTRRVMIVALTCVTVAILLGWPVRFVGADSPSRAPGPSLDGPPEIPAGCEEHAPLDGGEDFPGDYHCAGLAMHYYADGVGASPSPMWAGQWLFVDAGGNVRRGSCTFNRGIHPTINDAALPVTQSFPNDPDGSKGAYLTWRYGTTNDDVTAAALWAVFHYYAQDAAGATRAINPSTPLVPSLARVEVATGRPDIAAKAIALDAEAVRFSGAFTIDVQVAPDGRGEVDVLAGAVPVGDLEVTVNVDGGTLVHGESSATVVTDATGAAPFVVSPSSSAVTVSAAVGAPAPARVFRGAPADPRAQFGQTLITSGGSTALRAQVAAVVVPPPTVPVATVAETTPVAAPTSDPVPTVTVAQVPAPSMAPTTFASSTTLITPDTLAPVLTPAPTPLPNLTPTESVPDRPLPVTGRTAIGISYWATAMVVAGVGIVGALRRRRWDAPAE